MEGNFVVLFFKLLIAVEWFQLVPTYGNFCPKKKSNEDDNCKESELDVPTKIDIVHFDNSNSRL